MKVSTFFISFIFFCLSCSEENRHHSKRQQHRETQVKSLDNEQVDLNVIKYQEVNVDFHNPEGSLIHVTKRNVTRVIQPICRGMNGCLQVCEHLQEPHCKQSSIRQVADLWLNTIHQYTDWTQARDSLNLIAKKSDVAQFLKMADGNNQVIRALFSVHSSADCPLANKQNIFFSYTPQASLYLSPQTETDEEDSNDAGEVEPLLASNMKKIIDGNTVPFDIQIFTRFIKQCFGYNSKTFIEIAAIIENTSALDLGHSLISQACNMNDECIRLAYCEIDSDPVWQKVGSEMKDLGCNFNDFYGFTAPELN